MNHLSCDEARNHYGGVVSLIPVVIDCIKEWVAHSEKLPRNMLHSSVSDEELDDPREAPANPPPTSTRRPTFLTATTQTALTLPDKVRILKSKRAQKPRAPVVLERTPPSKLLDGPWRPPGRHAY